MKPTDYIALENAIANRVLLLWDNPAQLIAQAVYAKDYTLAREIVYGLEIPLSGLTPYIETVTKVCANYGAVMAHAEKSSNLTDPFLDEVVVNFETSLTITIADSIKKKWLEAISALEDNPEYFDEKADKKVKIIKADAKKDSFVKDFISFGDSSTQLVRMLSGLHTNRLATWGFVGEAEVLGFDKYKLSAVIDSKTSYFCRHIANGKEFYVSDAKDLIMRVLRAAPDDVKNLQPWVKSTKANLAELAELSAQELTQRGLHIPPFHPWCRTILMRVDALKFYFQSEKVPVVTETEYTPEEGVNIDLTKLPLFNALKARKEALSEKTAKALGVHATEKGIENWNKATVTNLDETLAEVLGQDAVTFAETAKNYPQSLKAGKDGAVKMQVEKEGLKVNTVIDPIDQSITLNFAEVQGTVAEVTQKFQETLKGLINIGKANNLTALNIGVKGTEALIVSGLGLTATELGVTAATMRSSLQSLIGIGVKIPESDLIALTAIIDSPKFNTYGLELLAKYPLKIGGSSIGQILFANTKIVASLDLTNAKALDKLLRQFGN